MADVIELEIDRDRLNDAPYTVKVLRGTEVRFLGISLSSPVQVHGFSSTYWTSSSNLAVDYGVPTSRFIRSSAPYGTTTLNIYDPADGSRKSFNIEVVASIASPNPYGLSPDIVTSHTGLNANEFVVSKTYSAYTQFSTIIHLRSDDPEVRFRLVDGDFRGNWVKDYFMNSVYRQGFEIGFRAPTEALKTKTVKVYIGTRVYTVSLTTSTELVPASHHVISMGKSTGNISMLDIKGFFGGGGNIRDYFRQGRNVPDMPANAGIPTSGNLKITDFRGAATAFFLAVRPENRPTRQLDTTSTVKSVGARWNIWSGEVDDWDLGYSKFIKDNAEFRYELTYTFYNGYGTTSPLVKPALTSSTGSPATWSSANKSVAVTVTGQKREEFYVLCTVKMYARHKDFPSTVVDTSATFRVRAVGT